MYKYLCGVKMKLLSKNFDSVIKLKAHGKYCTAPAYIYPSREDEFTSTPKYPPIHKVDPDSEAGKKQKWFDKIKRQNTVEEKLFEINTPRRWGWKCFIINEGIIPLNNLTFAQHMTKTHIIEAEKLPHYYADSSEESKAMLNEIRSHIIDSLEYQLDVRRKKSSDEPLVEEKQMTKFIITELNRVLMSNLWNKTSHLTSLQVDYSPRIEASWKIESLVETYERKEEDYEIPLEEIPEEYLDRPSDKYIQYLGSPILQLRSLQPLPHLVDLSEATIFSYSVPIYEYDPFIVLGYEMDRRYVNNIPGFWPGEDQEFSFMSYHDTNHIKSRPATYGPEDTKDALKSQALFASFGWLMPLACYKGFSTYHDVTYPMVTQTVLTDGREFTFAVYQLNTTELHWKNLYENIRSNICWITPTKRLYEVVENGKLKGFNDEVLLTLIQFYLNAPKTLENVNLKPYLGDKIKHIADYEDNEKVNWLEEKFKRCCTNNIVKKDMYDVKDWERIYKIKFAMRPQDARRRPFELRQNPFHENMEDHFRDYIPKALRPDKHLPKWRQRKFRRTFYPK